MDIKRLKVTEGDLLLIEYPHEKWNYSMKDHFQTQLKEWLKSKQLEHVNFLFIPADAFSITVVTVNDVLEESLLK